MTINNTLQELVKNPSAELSLLLEDINATIQLFSRASKLRPRLNPMIRWDNLRDDERQLISDFTKERDANGKIVELSLIVVCYGLLEKFVRELLERAVETIETELDEFDRLSESLVEENIFRTGIALQSVKGGERHVNYEYSLLARNLGTCIPGNSNYTLNAECFSIGHGTLTPVNIDQIFQRIGVKLDWDKFGANEIIKSQLGETRTRDCAKAVRKFIENLVTKRNAVSHSGGLEIVVDDNEFQNVTTIIPIFCRILVEQVGSQLQAKYG